jgi:hypothetical protein
VKLYKGNLMATRKLKIVLHQKTIQMLRRHIAEEELRFKLLSPEEQRAQRLRQEEAAAASSLRVREIAVKRRKGREISLELRLAPCTI